MTTALALRALFFRLDGASSVSGVLGVLIFQSFVLAAQSLSLVPHELNSPYRTLNGMAANAVLI